MIKRLALGLLALFALGAPAFAATPPPLPQVSYNVGVCDPRFSQNCIKPNSDGSINVNTSGGVTADVNITELGGVAVGGVASTQTASTVTLGGTFQTAIAANASRKGCTIQNTSALAEPLLVYFGTLGDATTGNSFSLPSGASINCYAGLIVLTGAVNVTAATTGHAFVYSAQ